MTHGEIRQFEVKHKDQIFKILHEINCLKYAVWQGEMSTDFEDQNYSFDLVYNGKIEISVRIRKHEYLKYKDFTIRSQSKCGYETEIDKLKKGFGNIYFYGWLDPNELNICEYLIVDINKIRYKLDDGGFRSNKDGTAFKFYTNFFLDENDAIIKEGKLI